MNSKKTNKHYSVAIIGGGITGASTLYVLATFTNINNIALIEKYDAIAQVNSHKDNNSQTLHEADIVLVAASGHSLLFAHELGYGKQFILLPVAGSFFRAPKALQGKVYTMQV